MFSSFKCFSIYGFDYKEYFENKITLFKVMIVLQIKSSMSFRDEDEDKPFTFTLVKKMVCLKCQVF